MRTRRRADETVEFEEFVAAAQQRLYRQAYLLTGESQAAQDLVQSTLVGLFLAWRRVDNPHGYARRTLVHEFLGQVRRADRGRRLAALAPWATTDATSHPTDAVTDRVALMDALATLTPRMRTVVVLRYWEDLSVEQTAALLGCSEGTVKSTSSKALAHLRAHLGDAYHERVPSISERTC